jgi:SAM-dependent methyltransferase
MDDTAKGQVSLGTAEVYDRFFVPALFQEWAPRVADAARLEPGHQVLDVACGTGALTCEVAKRVQPDGSAYGLDCNEAMLGVARRKAPAVEWRHGLAESLPFADHAFDAVVSQFGLMFFEDRVAALKEMWRVLRPGGRLALAVWDALDRLPGYAAMTALLQRLFGNQTANALRAPFACGDLTILRSLFVAAGIPGINIDTQNGTARFSSLEAWVHTDVKGWTLADLIDDAGYQRLLEESKRELSSYVQPDGTVAFRSSAHLATATK